MKSLTAFILVALALAALDPAQALARTPRQRLIAADTTLLPATTYYFPSGLQSDEDSWWGIGSYTTAASLYGYGLSVDSVLGFDADSSVLTIEAIFGVDQTATNTDTVYYPYGDDNILEHWYIWNDTVTTLTRTDQGRTINCGLPVHEARRFKITTIDTVRLRRFYEIPAKP